VLLPTALENLVNQKVKTVNAATETLLNVALKYGGERASLDNGEVTNAHLIGKNVGKTFGAE
jgi:hypothetical protein